MKQKCKLFTVRILCIGLVLLGFEKISNAALIIDGTNADQLLFTTMLNASTSGGNWDINSSGNLHFVPNGGVLNHFAFSIKSVTEFVEVGTILVGENLPGVFVDVFQPTGIAGIQAIDLADVAMLPVNSAQLDTQASTFIHAIIELMHSLRFDPSYQGSHSQAIDAANLQLTMEGGTGYEWKFENSQVRQVNGVTEIMIPWRDRIDPVIRYEVFTLNGAFDISSIKAGIFDPGVPYDGSDLDIGITDIYLESAVVPIPAAVWLFGSGLIGLIGFARRKARF